MVDLGSSTQPDAVSPDAPETAVNTLPALILLADGRFPSGAYAHSGGFEVAAEREGVTSISAVEQFLLGRLGSTGLVAAAFAAAACHVFHQSIRNDGGESLVDKLAPFDQEFEARTPSPVLRTVSRRLGRQLMRAGRTVWPHPGLERLARLPGEGLHQPVAFGAVAAAAGQHPPHVSMAIAQEAIAGPAMASVRLLGLDPFTVHALLARLAPEVVRVATEATKYAASSPANLPARAGYLLEISAEVHATWEVRLFAS